MVWNMDGFFYLTIFINLILGINLTDELNGKISIICFYISVPLYLIINYFIRNMKNKNNEKVKHVSTKYNKVVELNKKYEFKEIGKINRTIKEREYSHKSFDRARANSIILYQNNHVKSMIYIFNLLLSLQLHNERLYYIPQLGLHHQD